jgi:hypothetical protein
MVEALSTERVWIREHIPTVFSWTMLRHREIPAEGTARRITISIDGK